MLPICDSGVTSHVANRFAISIVICKSYLCDLVRNRLAFNVCKVRLDIFSINVWNIRIKED